MNPQTDLSRLIPQATPGGAIPITIDLRFQLFGQPLNLGTALPAPTPPPPVPVPQIEGGGETEAYKQPIVAPVDQPPRKGFNTKFLKAKVGNQTKTVATPFPEVTVPEMIAPLRVNGSYLHYEHFSVVVHKLRRLAIFTASNVDGSPQVRKPEVRPKADYTRDGLGGLTKNDTEQWVADPRIDPQYILPDIFYKKDRQSFDKGHIVRREDVCFGSSYEQIRRANGDTYHVTNCSPQVSGYNQAPSATSGGIWGRLEHHVLTFVKAQKDRYCLFAGPVLKDTDKEFEGVDDAGATRAKIPQRFWKVVCALKNGKLQVFAFILKQVLSGVKFEDEIFEPPIGWEEERITLKDLEKETGLLKFPKVYHDADQGTGA